MSETEVPVTAITSGPKYHWFGYYDKLSVDPSGRYVLGMEVGFEDHSPGPEDVVRVGMVDLDDDYRWIDLGESRAWCWQQGCMLQWRPGSNSEILWNDRQSDHYVCRMLDIQTGRRRTLPLPIYTVSPDGRSAIVPDFRRINDMRPGYGYAGLSDPNADNLAPETAGIHRMDLEEGSYDLIVRLSEIAAIPLSRADLSSAKHYFNHLLYNADGSRFVFLHRWRFGESAFQTRMLTASGDGSDVHIVDDSGYASHFIWRGRQHILAWSHQTSHGERFYLFEDGTSVVRAVGVDAMTKNGHCSYLPDGNWILNDTYADRRGIQELYLYHVPTSRRVSLAHLLALPGYEGELRCDLHPRFNRDGTKVFVDSAHEGGRQIYMIDIGQVVQKCGN